MVKNKSLLAFVILLLLGSLIGAMIIGCAGEAPAPAPSPAPAPAPSPAPAPAPSPAPAPAPSPTPAKPVQIDWLTTATTTTGYQLAVATSEIVNKYLPSVKLTAVASKSHEINLQRYIDEPEARVNRFYESNSVDWSKARQGKPPFTKPAPGLKCISTTIAKGAACFVSYDPSTGTPEGLKGKTIAVNVSAVIEYLPNIFLNDWGIFDQSKYMKVGLPKIIGSLMDGTVDVGFVPIANPRGPKNWAINPLLIETAAKAQLYITNIPKENIEALAAKTGDAFYPQAMPKDALGPNLPNQDIYVPGFVVCTWVDENMDEELVYNVIKTSIQHGDEFEGFLGPAYKGFAKFMAAANLPGGESDWHPGAIRAYKEAGLKIGEWME